MTHRYKYEANVTVASILHFLIAVEPGILKMLRKQYKTYSSNLMILQQIMKQLLSSYKLLAH